MGKKFTESKAFNIIVSILVAVGLWVYVTTISSEEGTVRIANVPVTVVGEDVLNGKGLMIDSSTDLTIDVELTGARTALANIASNPTGFLSARVDVSDIGAAGTYTLSCRITLDTSAITTGVRLTGGTTADMEINVTEMMTKTVDVRGNFEGTVAEGYRTNSMEIQPGTIRIQGPQSVVDRIAYAQVTVDGDELTRTFSGELPVEWMTADGETVRSSEITASDDTVSVVLPVVKTLEVPLTVNFTYGGGVTEENFDRYVADYVTIEPQTIQVSGEEEDIASLEGRSIVLDTIDLSTVVRDQQKFTFPIELTAELSNDSGIHEATVTVSVRGLATKTVETSNIEIINVPSGFTADAITQSIQVRLPGPQEALDSVEGYQVRVVIDLADQNLSRGQFFFNATRIYFDGDSSCGVIASESESGYGAVVSIQ